MGITYSYLGKIERGIHPYSQPILEAAAKLYRCTVTDILTRAPSESVTVFHVKGTLNDLQKGLAVRVLDALKEPEQEPE